MTRAELTKLNIGENLDHLMNLDPRGYGICRLLYKNSRSYTQAPLTIHAAEQLLQTIDAKAPVYIITGFILAPFNHPETDGAIGSVLLARALILAADAKPFLICPEDAKKAIAHCAASIGLQVLESSEEVMSTPLSIGVIPFTKEKKEAKNQAEDIISRFRLPSAVIAVEAPGANAEGEYHNAVGENVTPLEAKSDALFCLLRQKGVMSLAIGDLGNEIGMGTIGTGIRKNIPYTDKGECRCGCKGGILAASEADCIITATTSDWGCYGLIAALAYLKRNMEIMHTGEMEAKLIDTACKNGLIDMNGPGIQGIDGFPVEMNAEIVSLMRSGVKYALDYEKTGGHWFDGVIKKMDL
ncbi:MAG: DUF4392 domain-containing protein [Lachnospiraceae bacterium]|nr:DUF4392 domain-containing protein [Lachnospiraceae bacterium]